MDGFAASKENKAQICSYIYGKEILEKDVFSPIYYSRKLIDENFNHFDYI